MSELGEVEEDQAYQDALTRMGNMTLADVLRQGQEALLKDLVARVNTGRATHQEKAILRNLLRDNGLTMAITPAPASEVPDEEDLPSLSDPDYR